MNSDHHREEKKENSSSSSLRSSLNGDKKEQLADEEEHHQELMDDSDDKEEHQNKQHDRPVLRKASDILISSTEEENLLHRHSTPLEDVSSINRQQRVDIIQRILGSSHQYHDHDMLVLSSDIVVVDDDNNNEPYSSFCQMQSWRTACSKLNLTQCLRNARPFQHQCNKYSGAIFCKDLVAGITVAVMAIPLSMSYAKLAGLPAYYGLYAVFVPPCIYPIFGTCRQLAVGPAALVSLVVNTGLTNIMEDEGFEDTTAPEYIARYTELAIQCSFLAGIINIAMGILRFGFVTQFLSRALISGFVSGAAVIIALSQVKYLFGYNFPSSSRIYEIIKNLVRYIDKWNWKTFIMGALSIVVLLAVKYTSQNPSLNQKYPNIKWIRALGPFLVSIIAIVLTYTLNLDERGIPIVGEIPSGLPSVTVNQWTPLSSKLWTPVISMVIVGFVQSVAISKRFAYKHGYEIDSSQELISLGMANLFGGMFQSYPVTGAIGQSAVNDDIGAETGVASVVTGLVVMIVLLFLTFVFENMPLCVLAAIVISFVLSMFDYNEAFYLYRVHKFDFTVWVVAFLATMFLGVEYGLLISVAVSLLIVIYESVYPHTAVLGRLPGTSLYRNIKQYPGAEQYDGLVIVRIDAPLYFANAHNARDKVRKYKRVADEALERRNAGQVRYIILDLSPVSHIDTTALHVLEDMYKTQKSLGVQICFCNPGIAVAERLVRCGLVDLVGRRYFFSDVVNAVQWCLIDLDQTEGSSMSP